MPLGMSFRRALSILSDHTAKQGHLFVIDAELNDVALDLLLGHHTGLFTEDLALAIHVVWAHYCKRVGRLAAKLRARPDQDFEGLGRLVVDPEGRIDVFLRLLVKEELDE